MPSINLAAARTNIEALAGIERSIAATADRIDALPLDGLFGAARSRSGLAEAAVTARDARSALAGFDAHAMVDDVVRGADYDQLGTDLTAIALESASRNVDATLGQLALRSPDPGVLAAQLARAGDDVAEVRSSLELLVDHADASGTLPAGFF